MVPGFLENFAKGTLEHGSLQVLYNYLVRHIAKSDHLVLTQDESVARDLQDYEIHDDLDDSEGQEPTDKLVVLENHQLLKEFVDQGHRRDVIPE